MANLTRIVRPCGLLLLGLLVPGPVSAQVAPSEFFTEPILIHGGGGHYAPVRSMLFTPDGAQLLTGGMDKVIQVWSQGAGRTRLVRTLRPPNWRASRGQVLALALSPIGIGDGVQRVLAVAGSGVLGSRGEILLFDYPGPTGQGSGDISGQLSAIPDEAGRIVQPGHTDVVNSLAFTPDGKFLASASNDRTVRIWDMVGRRQVSVMEEATGPVNSIAIFDGGKSLAAGGSDGFLRLYDITNPALPRLRITAPTVRNGDPLSGSINTLAVSSTNLWIVVGTEGGNLIRYDAATLGGARFLPTNARSGPVEALAISPDGRKLATSTVTRNLGTPADTPTFSCLVEIRGMPDGQVLERLPLLENLAQALAFNPAGTRLAYSGGDSQAIYIKSTSQDGLAPEVITGQGASVWDVGFRADSRAIRFARTRPAVPGQAPEYEYFVLRERNFYNPDPPQPAFRHASGSEAGWTIRPTGLYSLEFRNARGQAWPGNLDPQDDRRWFCYTVIPPNPLADHADPVAAVGCGSGVVLWNLRTGGITRFFNGHAGPVYSVASSPDGRWLVSGSIDQTVRIWSLAGCDRLPVFGARFERRPDGAWVVGEITPGGFADGIKLKRGQVIEKFYVGSSLQSKEQTAAILPGLDDQPPTSSFSFYTRTGPGRELVGAVTTRRDSPSLTLFPDINHEWVLWTPRGHYDTSVKGDQEYLGWLTNQGSVTQLSAGRYDPIVTFEPRYRQKKSLRPNILDQLLETADGRIAMAPLPPEPPLPPAPPVPRPEPAVPPVPPGPVKSGLKQLALTAVGPAPLPGVPINAVGGFLNLEYFIKTAQGTATIANASILVNGKTVSPVDVGAGAASANGRVVVPIPRGEESVVTLKVVDAWGVARGINLLARNPAPPAPDQRRSRLEIISIGSETFADRRLPTIQHAQNDANDLANFLRDRMINPSTGSPFAPDRVNVRRFVEPQERGPQPPWDATQQPPRDTTHSHAVAPLSKALEDLKNAEGDRKLVPNDAVAVVIESHYFSHRSQPFFATAEPGNALIPASISAADLADRLGGLTKQGCRVIVLLDAVHRVEAQSWEDDLEIKEWIRQLQMRSNVATFVASSHGPSLPTNDRVDARPHRRFAEGVLAAVSPTAASRLRKPGGGPMTFFEFDRTLREWVLENTRRRQHTGAYLPETIPNESPFLDTTAVPGAR